MSYLCHNLTCIDKCCNAYGFCPNVTSGYRLESHCYYYYDSEAKQEIQRIMTIVLGSIIAAVFLFFIVICICSCRRKVSPLKQTKSAINPHTTAIEKSNNRLIVNQQSNPFPSSTYPNIYNPALDSTIPFPMYGDLPNGQAAYGQPIYNQAAYNQHTYPQPAYPHPSYAHPIIISNL